KTKVGYHSSTAPATRERISALVDVVCMSYKVKNEDRSKCMQEMLSNPKISSEKDSGRLRELLLDLAMKRAKEARISRENMAKRNNKYPAAIKQCAKFVNDTIDQLSGALQLIKEDNPEYDLTGISMNVSIAGDQLDYCEIGLANDDIVDHNVTSIIHHVRMFQRMVAIAFDL
ncbi:hypothetical protein PIB30_028847, partial [Stylosanthes scabra]|nr:hypothetical protein [Stylosanthes scabra]